MMPGGGSVASEAASTGSDTIGSVTCCYNGVAYAERLTPPAAKVGDSRNGLGV